MLLFGSIFNFLFCVCDRGFRTHWKTVPTRLTCRTAARTNLYQKTQNLFVQGFIPRKGDPRPEKQSFSEVFLTLWLALSTHASSSKLSKRVRKPSGQLLQPDCTVSKEYLCSSDCMQNLYRSRFRGSLSVSKVLLNDMYSYVSKESR